jgi:hypothetical protein
VPYVDLNTIHNPATGTVPPAAWGDQVRDNLEFLIDPPACTVFNSTGVTLTNATDTLLSANSETFDNDGMHSTVANQSRITAQTAGRYLVFQQLRFAANSTGARRILYRLNGGAWFVSQATAAPSSFDCTISASWTVNLAASSYIETGASQGSGGNLDVQLEGFSLVFITR